MQKKILIQTSLIFTILITLVIFLKFFYKSDTSIKKFESEIDNIRPTDSNLMNNIRYIATDKIGNEYRIFSKFAKFNENQTNMIFMTQVEGVLKFTNSTPISIFADHAIYNKINHDTNFYKNVKINYDEHKISSHNLDLFFEKNLASISKNIIYKSLNTEMHADKIEIDLLTKNSKIFMDEKLKKVKIISLK